MSKGERVGDDPASATVLIVEDDPKIVALLTKGLRREGFQVEGVSTGREGLVLLARGGVDVLLLDLGLPDIDGLDMLRQMRERGMDVPVIVVTGRSDTRDRAIAVSLGVRAYLTKPFAWAELRATLRAALDRAPSPHLGDARGMPGQSSSP
jgi:two-component system response regulator QseB